MAPVGGRSMADDASGPSGLQTLSNAWWQASVGEDLAIHGRVSGRMLVRKSPVLGDSQAGRAI